MKEIETDRLFLRRLYIEDAEEMFNNWANDPEVTKFLTWNPHKSVNETKEILTAWQKDYDDPNCYRYGITLKSTNELIGSIDLVRILDGVPEIGYCSGKRFWGNGYMTEALRAILAILKSDGFKKVKICAVRENIGSNRVIQKNNFKCTHQEIRQASQIKKEIVTINWYEKEL